MRPRHDSHAENKNISPPLARAEFLVPESGDPAPWPADHVPVYVCPTDGISVFRRRLHVDAPRIAFSPPVAASRKFVAFTTMCKLLLNNAPEKLAAKV